MIVLKSRIIMYHGDFLRLDPQFRRWHGHLHQRLHLAPFGGNVAPHILSSPVLDTSSLLRSSLSHPLLRHFGGGVWPKVIYKLFKGPVNAIKSPIRFHYLALFSRPFGGTESIRSVG